MPMTPAPTIRTSGGFAGLGVLSSGSVTAEGHGVAVIGPRISLMKH
jgi:hypothetical protein